MQEKIVEIVKNFQLFFFPLHKKVVGRKKENYNFNDYLKVTGTPKGARHRRRSSFKELFFWWVIHLQKHCHSELVSESFVY